MSSQVGVAGAIRFLSFPGIAGRATFSLRSRRHAALSHEIPIVHDLSDVGVNLPPDLTGY
jgi:hypothetical protein